jgi:hypothetical protein
MKKVFSKKVILVIVGVLIIAGVIYCLVARHTKQKNVQAAPIAIILSPRPQDGVLSLGGLISQNKQKVIIVNFFIDPAATSTKNESSSFGDNVQNINLGYSFAKDGAKDRDALNLEITRDIQQIVASHVDSPVLVYGPGYFSVKASPPETMLVHNAFNTLISLYPNTQTKFYYYETYPDIVDYQKTGKLSPQGYLEEETGFVLEQQPISLTHGEVKDKIKLVSQILTLNPQVASEIENYTGDRCKSLNTKQPACEMAFKIVLGNE